MQISISGITPRLGSTPGAALRLPSPRDSAQSSSRVPSRVSASPAALLPDPPASATGSDLKGATWGQRGSIPTERGWVCSQFLKLSCTQRPFLMAHCLVAHSTTIFLGLKNGEWAGANLPRAWAARGSGISMLTLQLSQAPGSRGRPHSRPSGAKGLV